MAIYGIAMYAKHRWCGSLLKKLPRVATACAVQHNLLPLRSAPPVNLDLSWCMYLVVFVLLVPTHQVLMYLDKTIGQLVDYLEKEGWLDNSVIVVASDNGGCAPDGGSNLPLRGVKNSYWEGGVKVRKTKFET